MKRLFIYIFIFVLICFFIPVVFTRKSKEVIIQAETNQVVEENQGYEYKKYGTVRLLHNATGEVQELNMDEYLYRSCCSRNASKF